jgi:hypothetical protein
VRAAGGRSGHCGTPTDDGRLRLQCPDRADEQRQHRGARHGLDENQLFVDGSEVKKGDLLYSLEKLPFLAAVNVQKAAVARAEAKVENDARDFRRAQQLAQVKVVPSRPPTMRKRRNASPQPN